MKTIILIRHAKSSWSDVSLPDHDRPLNGRGKRDAPRMAAFLAREGLPNLAAELGSSLTVDGILTSTAKRARRTARAFTEAFGLSSDEVLQQPQLFHARSEAIQRSIQRLPDQWETVLVFGHNPGFTDAANEMISEAGYIDNVPTCGIVVSTNPIASWKQWQLAEAQQRAFYYPKQLV